MTGPAALRASVIVPFKNEEATIPLVLDSLARQAVDFPYEVIFADGCSTDRSVEVIRAHPLKVKADVRVLPLPPENHGMNVGRNMGAAAARAPLLVFMQADVRILDPDALAKTVRLLDEPGVVGTTFVGLGAGADFRRYDFWGQVFLARYQGLRCEHDFDTKFNGVRRDVFERIGGFDDRRFPYGGEDFDFRVRLAREGRIVGTGVEVEHLHGFGKRHTWQGLLRKYARNAECMGATTPVYLAHRDQEPGYLTTLASRLALCACCIAAPLPWAWPWAALGVLAFSLAWSAPAYRHVRSPRLAAVPFLSIAAMYVFTVYYLRGLAGGRVRVKIENPMQ
jgi:glycosyltransferase involved in cell wall biosynthesis